MKLRRFILSNCIGSLPARARSQHNELSANSQWGSLLGVRSTSVSGNNPGSQAFPGGANSGREQVQQTARLIDYLVGDGEHTRRNGEAQSFGGL